MSGITPLTGTGQISVSEMNKTKNLKQTTNSNQANSSFSQLRDWFRAYAFDPDGNMPSTGNVVSHSNFHQNLIPGMRVRVANETSSHYRDQENAMLSFSNFPGSTQHVNANESNATEDGPGYYVDYRYQLSWVASNASNYPSGHRGAHAPGYASGTIETFTSVNAGGSKGSLAASTGGTVPAGGVKAVYSSEAGGLSGYDGFSGTGIARGQTALLPAVTFTVNTGGTAGNGTPGELVTSGAAFAGATFTLPFKLPGSTAYTDNTHTLRADFVGDELNGQSLSGDGTRTMAELVTDFIQDLFDDDLVPDALSQIQYKLDPAGTTQATADNIGINGDMTGSTFNDSDEFQTSVLSAGQVITFSGGAWGLTVNQLAAAKGGITVNSGGGVRSEFNGVVLQATGGLNAGDTLPATSGWRTYGRGNGGARISNGVTYTITMSGERPTGGSIADVIYCAMKIIPGLGNGNAQAQVYNKSGLTGYRSSSNHIAQPGYTNLSWTASNRVSNWSNSCVFMLGTAHPDGDAPGSKETDSIHY